MNEEAKKVMQESTRILSKVFPIVDRHILKLAARGSEVTLCVMTNLVVKLIIISYKLANDSGRDADLYMDNILQIVVESLDESDDANLQDVLNKIPPVNNFRH